MIALVLTGFVGSVLLFDLLVAVIDPTGDWLPSIGI
jgi:hypothetical protein